METKRHFGVRLNLEHPGRVKRSADWTPERLAALERLLSLPSREGVLGGIAARLRDGSDPATRRGGVFALFPGGSDPTSRPVEPRLPLPVVPVELIVRVEPPPVEPAGPPPAPSWGTTPAGLEQWYRNEHLPRGRSSREQDLAAARERFGPWPGDRTDLRGLRKQYAPSEWLRGGRPKK